MKKFIAWLNSTHTVYQSKTPVERHWSRYDNGWWGDATESEWN